MEKKSREESAEIKTNKRIKLEEREKYHVVVMFLLKLQEGRTDPINPTHEAYSKALAMS